MVRGDGKQQWIFSSLEILLVVLEFSRLTRKRGPWEQHSDTLKVSLRTSIAVGGGESVDTKRVPVVCDGG